MHHKLQELDIDEFSRNTVLCNTDAPTISYLIVYSALIVIQDRCVITYV